MVKYIKDDLHFLPLGGSNEIGMNVNLYQHKGKWLMIDVGAGFADDSFPGVQMLAPELDFIIERKEDLLAVVFTHAHEDHIGSIANLYTQLGSPTLYATPFTAGVIRNKMAEKGLLDEAKIIEFDGDKTLELSPFTLDFIGITHSVPEMNGVVIRTEVGNIFHTGDWKFDPDPVVGDVSDFDAMQKLGEEGVLAMVCDSTNVFNNKFSGSEGDLYQSLLDIIKERKGRVVVATFASNVARVDTIARAGMAAGRKIVLCGWSLRRITSIAQEAGYLEGIDFLSDKEVSKYKRHEVLIISTGCQGEPNAQTFKIANNIHPIIGLSKKDTVIFSSKIIPGNEKKIFKLFNKFVHLGCEVITEKDHQVHVSGHPSREELTRMYELIKPEIALPVHGEPVHLAEHVGLTNSLKIPHSEIMQNGQMVKISAKGIEKVGMVETGYLAVDGKLLQPQDGDVMRMRRKMQNDGLIFVTIVMDEHGGLLADPAISYPGVIDEREFEKFTQEVTEEVADAIDGIAKGKNGTERLYKTTRSIIRREIKRLTGKRPTIEIQVLEV